MEIRKLLIQQIFWRALSIVFVFFVNVMFARALGSTVMGEVLYLFAIYSFVIQFTGFSMETGVAYYAAKNEIPSNRLIGFSIIWSVVATLAVLGALLVIDNFSDLQYPLWYPLAFVLGNLFTSFGTAYCFSRMRFVLPAIITLLTCFLTILLLLYHDYLSPLPYTLTALYFMLYLVQGSLLILTILVTSNSTPLVIGVQKSDLRKIATYSAYAFIANVLFLLVTRIDYVFVKEYCSLAELGNYAQASRIAQLFFLLPATISTVVFPMIASEDAGNSQRPVNTAIWKLLALNSIGAITLAAIGYWIFPLVFGSTFSIMYQPFLWLLPGIIAMSIVHPYAAYFAGKNRIWINIIGGFLALVVIVPGNFLFIPEYGINAAAIVSSVGYILYSAFVIYKYVKL